MRKNGGPAELPAGVDNSTLDTRPFDARPEDIGDICRFFSLGKPRHFEKDKDVAVSHANFFVFVATARGQYALKFYPKEESKAVTVEYAVNRSVVRQSFPTPVMHAGRGGRPFLPVQGRLTACFSYIKGVPAWQRIGQRDTIHRINAATRSLKKILSAKQRLPVLKQESFTATAKSLIRESGVAAPYRQKEFIAASLQEACRTYKNHRRLFTRQRLHNNCGLTNFLLQKKTLYTLDLIHVREDYAFSDLASLVISCFLFETPVPTIRYAVRDYIDQHDLGPDHLPVLRALLQAGLVKEYLKNIRREKSAPLTAQPPELVRSYLYHLAARKKSIIRALRKIKNSEKNLFDK